MNSRLFFSGKWRLYESKKEYNGILDINTDSNDILLTLYLPADVHRPFPQVEYKNHIPYIIGQVITGDSFLLYDCTLYPNESSFYEVTKQVIRAKYAFRGKNINSISDIKFTKALLDYGNILKWVDLCNLEYKYREQYGYFLQWNNDNDIKLNLHMGPAITFCGSLDPIVSGLKFADHAGFSQKILVAFNFENEVEWKELLWYSHALQYLMGLGMQQKIWLKSAMLIRTFKRGLHLEDCYIHVYLGIDSGNTPWDRFVAKSANQREYLFTLRDLVEISALDSWMRNFDMVRPILDLYFMFYLIEREVIEITFINTVQALETFHSRIYANNYGAYRIRVASLMNTMAKAGHSDSDLQIWEEMLLDEHQQRASQVFLRSRLADMIIAEGNEPFVPSRFTIQDYITRIVMTRNYYTHYNEKYAEKIFPKSEIPYLNVELAIALEYHFLVLLGFEERVAKEKIMKKMQRIDAAHLDAQQNVRKHDEVNPYMT